VCEHDKSYICVQTVNKVSRSVAQSAEEELNTFDNGEGSVFAGVRLFVRVRSAQLKKRLTYLDKIFRIDGRGTWKKSIDFEHTYPTEKNAWCANCELLCNAHTFYTDRPSLAGKSI